MEEKLNDWQLFQLQHQEKCPCLTCEYMENGLRTCYMDCPAYIDWQQELQKELEKE